MISPYKPTLLQEICRWCYSCVLLMLIPIIGIFSLLKVIRGKANLGSRSLERLGVLPKIPNKGGLLVHCVSVGEVVTAAKLLKAIQQQQPELAITITTTTTTGSEQVKLIFADQVQHFYLPYDLPISMQHMLNKVRPSQVLVTEVELWPNMIHACWQRQIPVTIINARMTDKSVNSYQKISALFQPMLHKLHYVCAQGKRDYDNYAKLGLAVDKLNLSNNIKFDLELTEHDRQQTQQLKQTLNLPECPIFIAGSTHDPEEKLLLDAFKQLRKEFNDLLLILVPRHPQRFDKVYDLCLEYKLSSIRMSQQQSCQPDTQIILADTLGQLNHLYGLSDFAYVGGSIANRGGHNPLEAAIHGLPVLMGPHTYNNPQICQLLAQADVLYQVENATEISQTVGQWLHSPQTLETLADNAKAVVQHNAGAVANTLKVLFPS